MKDGLPDGDQRKRICKCRQQVPVHPADHQHKKHGVIVNRPCNGHRLHGHRIHHGDHGKSGHHIHHGTGKYRHPHTHLSRTGKQDSYTDLAQDRKGISQDRSVGNGPLFHQPIEQEGHKKRKADFYAARNRISGSKDRIHRHKGRHSRKNQQKIFQIGIGEGVMDQGEPIPLMNVSTETTPKSGDVIRDFRCHPVSQNNNRYKYADHLGNKGQRLFLNRGCRLKDGDQKTNHKGNQQNRCRKFDD